MCNMYNGRKRDDGAMEKYINLTVQCKYILKQKIKIISVYLPLLHFFIVSLLLFIFRP